MLPYCLSVKVVKVVNERLFIHIHWCAFNEKAVGISSRLGLGSSEHINSRIYLLSD